MNKNEIVVTQFDLHFNREAARKAYKAAK